MFASSIIKKYVNGLSIISYVQIEVVYVKLIQKLEVPSMMKQVISMNRKDIVLHLWDTTYDVEGWHPPLKDALENLDHEGALWRPHKDAHNIWELLNHLICYKDRFICRLEDKSFEPDITDNEQTFQRGIGTTEEEWQGRVSHLAHIQTVIRDKVSALSDTDLDKPLPDAPIGGQMLSLASHDSYHTGQIMFLRKLQGLWPQKRDV